MDIGVTSEPVPAVVGTKTSGNLGPLAFETPQASSIFSLDPKIKDVNLATSIEEPPPNPITPVAFIFFPISIDFKSVFRDGSASTSSNISTFDENFFN